MRSAYIGFFLVSVLEVTGTPWGIWHKLFLWRPCTKIFFFRTQLENALKIIFVTSFIKVHTDFVRASFYLYSNIVETWVFHMIFNFCFYLFTNSSDKISRLVYLLIICKSSTLKFPLRIIPYQIQLVRFLICLCI